MPLYSPTVQPDSKAAIRQKAKQDFAKRPLIQAPLWATGVAYLLSQIVRHSNGQLMQCVVAGTSDATTEPTFSATALISEASGNGRWAWLGKSKVNNDGYQVPTITVDTTIPTGATANLLYNNPSTGGAIIAPSVITNGGTLYVDGTYTNVPLTGGSGAGAVALSVTVSGGVVTAIKMPYAGTGTGYVEGDILSINNANLGGSGSGLTVQFASVLQSQVAAFTAQPVSGGKTILTSNVYANSFIFNRGGSSFPLSAGLWMIDFITDDPWVGIGLHNSSGSRLRVFVDGYPVEEAPSVILSGTPCYYKIDWSGIRQLRRYSIQVPPYYSMKSIAVLASSRLYAPQDDFIYGVSIGDSFLTTISSYPITDRVNDLGSRALKLVGVNAVKAMAIGSTGYITGKTADDENTSAANYTALAVLQNNPNTDISTDVTVAVCCHGLNDVGANDPATKAAALQTWSTLRAQYPNAVISIFGPWSENSGPSVGAIATDAALLEGFTEWGDAKSFYHSICSDTAGAWTTGTGKWGTTTGTGNADFYTGEDGTHPSLVGREYLAQRMAKNIDADLQSIGL